MSLKNKLPEFKDEGELAAWVESHDISSFMDELDEVTDQVDIVPTRFSTKALDVRLRTEHMEAIEELAQRRGLPYQALVQQWLLEKLTQEAPDLIVK
jgi:predicted DNA binding CopG/RHH family protein